MITRKQTKSKIDFVIETNKTFTQLNIAHLLYS